MSEYTILPYDCVDAMHHLIDEGSVHCCVTSPPYFRKRDYQHIGQMGMEATPAEYVAALVQVARAVRRVLRDDGTFWLNLGDTYASRSTYNAPQSMATANGWKQAGRGPNTGGVPQGFKDKDLLGMPWRVAIALQDDGWYLRQDIIWAKKNPMPESARDRFTSSHEHIFLLTKSPRYYFDQEAVKEPATYGWRGSKFHEGQTAEHQLGRAQKVRPSVKQGGFGGKGPIPGTGQSSFRAIREMRNRRDVWSISNKPFKGPHFATFPPDLIEPCILAGCPEGGTVLDPFGGSGTTALVALRHRRRAVLCELNPEYVAMAHARIAGGR